MIIEDYLSQYIKLMENISSDGKRRFSIEEFVLINGREFTKKGKVLHQDYGEMKACYKNSFLLMLKNRDLYYCEGFATFCNLPLPVLHAWCVDKNGIVYDPTWKDGGDEYFGIAFNREFTSSRILKNRACLIDDWEHRWPLLTGKEKKEWRANI